MLTLKQLPIYTGESLIEVRRNEAAQLAHKTLLDLARTQIDVVMQCIIAKIVEISKVRSLSSRPCALECGGSGEGGFLGEG